MFNLLPKLSEKMDLVDLLEREALVNTQGNQTLQTGMVLSLQGL